VTSAFEYGVASDACVMSLLLVVAGAIKLSQPRVTASSLRRVSKRLMQSPQHRLEAAARSIGTFEISMGAGALALDARPAVVVAALVVVTFVAFVAITRSAQRRGASCGCWGSLSDGPAGDREVRRRVIFVALAVIPLAARIATPGLQQVPPTVMVSVFLSGIVIGLVLACESTPNSLARLAGGANIGVWRGATTAHNDVVSRRDRRVVLDALRADEGVAKVVALISAGSGVSWFRARVTTPPGHRGSTKYFVAIPGDRMSLRVVVHHGRPLLIIGESSDKVVTLSSSRLVVAPTGSPRVKSRALVG
jgi:hypothetical protein